MSQDFVKSKFIKFKNNFKLLFRNTGNASKNCKIFIRKKNLVEIIESKPITNEEYHKESLDYLQLREKFIVSKN